MNSQPPDFDDAASEALIRGSGREVAPAVAQAVSDMRSAFTSQPPVVGAELSALMAGSSAVTSAGARRRFERMRSSMIAKIAAGAAAAMAATGGLAVAGALPAPVQHVFSEVGIGGDSPHHSGPTHAVDASTGTQNDDIETTLPGDDTGGTTVTSVGDNQGNDGSGAAQNGNQGCDQGGNASAVAFDGQSNNDNSQCDTSTTAPGAPTPTTIGNDNGGQGDQGGNQGSQGGNQQGDQGSQGGNQQGDQGSQGGNQDGTTSTTIVATTPTTTYQHQGGGGNQGGNNQGGNSQGGNH